ARAAPAPAGACSAPGSAPGTSTRRSWLCEHLLNVMEAAHQGVDLARGVVQIERRPCGRRYSEAQVERPGAVVADAHRDAELVVEDLADVVRVDALQRERHRAAAHLHRVGADEPQAGHLAQ